MAKTNSTCWTCGDDYYAKKAECRTKCPACIEGTRYKEAGNE